MLDNTGLKFFTVGVPVSWFFLALNIPFWFIFHLYIEAIKPDSYGIARSPCFCFQRCSKKKEQIHVVPGGEQEMAAVNADETSNVA